MSASLPPIPNPYPLRLLLPSRDRLMRRFCGESVSPGHVQATCAWKPSIAGQPVASLRRSVVATCAAVLALAWIHAQVRPILSLLSRHSSFSFLLTVEPQTTFWSMPNESSGAAKAADPTLLGRRLEGCVGWNCLTVAQKSGIIFSIATVSVVIFLVYMHCLGRAAISRRERTSVRLPGGRRVARHRHQPRDVALAQLPVAQHLPGYPSHVMYQPALFSFDGTHYLGSQPLGVAGPYPPAPLAAAVATAHPILPSMPQQERQQGTQGHRQEDGQEQAPPGTARTAVFDEPALQATPSPSPTPPPRPEQPNWRQQLGRACRLPVGRASTISSLSDAAAAPSGVSPGDGMDRNEAVDRSSRRPSPPACDGQEQDIAGDPASGSCAGGEAGIHGGTESCSVQTNLATVHSDDFQMTDPTQRIAPRSGEPRVFIVGTDEHRRLIRASIWRQEEPGKAAGWILGPLEIIPSGAAIGEDHMMVAAKDMGGCSRWRASCRRAKHPSERPSTESSSCIHVGCEKAWAMASAAEASYGFSGKELSSVWARAAPSLVKVPI
ncbi:hypothetical protein CDD83_688 [Cordyceps sp. RAO-2017]|nr:hypothetical protein CDD83_688 [Cordyceps sp. RAO-2017]